MSNNQCHTERSRSVFKSVFDYAQTDSQRIRNLNRTTGYYIILSMLETIEKI